MAGVGPNGPDYVDFAKLYFSAANQLPSGTPLSGSGKVAHAYDQELQQRFGYTGTSADALSYFLALPSEHQKRSDNQSQDSRSRYQVVGVGALTEDQAKQLAEEKRLQVGR